MTTSTTTTASRLALKRLGPSDYGLKLNTSKGVVELRASGTYVKGTNPSSTVRNAWVWTARLNNKIVDSPETLRRKRDAVDLLIAELERQGYEHSNQQGTAKTPEPETSQAELAKKIDEGHPIFRPAPSSEPTRVVDPIFNKTVRVRGTTLVGTVIALTQGERERLRLQFPEGLYAWASRDAVEELDL